MDWRKASAGRRQVYQAVILIRLSTSRSGGGNDGALFSVVDLFHTTTDSDNLFPSKFVTCHRGRVGHGSIRLCFLNISEWKSNPRLLRSLAVSCCSLDD